jgi:hypothetical protein|tara:strand:- start:35 stop:241 length:207 start_codon:yes stop_codon:yes gene_type:complete
MEALDIDNEAQRLANSTIKSLIDMGYVLTLAESYAIVDRIVDLLEEEDDKKHDRAFMVEGDEDSYGDI